MFQKGRDVYVLIRVFDAYLSDSIMQSEFFNRLSAALQSLQRNAETYRKRGEVFLLINDDTPRLDTELYQDHALRLKYLLKDNGFVPGANVFFTDSPGHEGSSAAALRVRRLFVNLARIKSLDLSSTIAVSLDQDDELCDGALVSIARGMKPNGIVLSQFVVKDDKDLDITDDGGRVHNKLSRFLRIPRWIRRSVLCRRNDVDRCAHWKEAKRHKTIAAVWMRIHRFLHQHLPVRDIIYASTISWSKTYSGEILERYLRDLDEYFATKRPGTDDMTLEYFKAHPAYEDFLDFYTLLYDDVQLSGTCRKTHKYIKRSDSITSMPSIEDFRDHRTASLINLVDLCYYHGKGNGNGKLRTDYQYKLLRHLSVKILQVEVILAKYRNEFDSGSESEIKAAFAKLTHDGYFYSKLSRLILSENRGSVQDDELFEKAILTINPETKSHFLDLYSKVNKIKEYNLDVKSYAIKYTMMKACEAENIMHAIRIRQKTETVEHRYDQSLTPKQKLFWKIIAADILLIMAAAGGFIFFLNKNNASSEESAGKLIAGFCTLMAALLSFFFNESSKLHTMGMEELSRKRLYYSEFEDLIRHLEANMKIMIQLLDDMKKGIMERPTSVHLNNLKWPSDSCLFSDEMAKIIDKDKVDEFARLKVNLRNINNSAEWLLEYSESADYKKDKMIEMLDWELTRYVGYYINFVFMKDHNFSFPSQLQIDTYIADRGVRNKFNLLFMSNTLEESKESVDRLIGQYYRDRREKRSVIEA